MADRVMFHPTIRRIRRTVPADRVEEWREAGWRLTKPTDPKPADEPKPEQGEDD